MKYELDDFALMLLVGQYSEPEAKKENRKYAKALLAEYVISSASERKEIISIFSENIAKLIADLAALDEKMKEREACPQN